MFCEKYCTFWFTLTSWRWTDFHLIQINIPNTSYDAFKALLEYLYSDHAPIEEGDPVGILVLANQFCQPRLVTLAEYYVTKCVENSFNAKGGADADVDVVGILYSAKVELNNTRYTKFSVSIDDVNF